MWWNVPRIQRIYSPDHLLSMSGILRSQHLHMPWVSWFLSYIHPENIPRSSVVLQLLFQTSIDGENLHEHNKPMKLIPGKPMLNELTTSFCSKQWEHQNAPYILAPMEFRCFAKAIAYGLDDEVISVLKYGSSMSPELEGVKQKKKIRI